MLLTLTTSHRPATDIGFLLRKNPDTTVGIDVAYISPETAQANPSEVSVIDGAPVLAVEILSPSDTHEDVSEKVAEYLRCGVQQVWVLDPVFRTIMVYRPDAPPQSFNTSQEIVGDKHLSGLRLGVAQLFGV